MVVVVVLASPALASSAPILPGRSFPHGPAVHGVFGGTACDALVSSPGAVLILPTATCAK